MTVCAAVSAQNDRQLIREGNRLYRQKQYAQAEVLYRKAIAKNAENPQAQYNLGCALMMQQKDSAAVIQYQNAAKLEKNKLRQSKSWHNVGVMYYNFNAEIFTETDAAEYEGDDWAHKIIAHYKAELDNA